MIREALVVGINHYPLLKDKAKAKPQHLLKAAADAEAIARLLETYGNFRVRRFPAVAVEGRYEVDPHPMWDKRGNLILTLPGNDSPVGSVAIHGEYLVSGSDDGRIRLWNREGK